MLYFFQVQLIHIYVLYTIVLHPFLKLLENKNRLKNIKQKFLRKFETDCLIKRRDFERQVILFDIHQVHLKMVTNCRVLYDYLSIY